MTTHLTKIWWDLNKHKLVEQAIPEAAMTEQLLTQEEVAFRWKISEATLERDRSLKQGVRYLKIGGLIRYRLKDVLDYEDSCIHEPKEKTT